MSDAASYNVGAWRFVRLVEELVVAQERFRLLVDEVLPLLSSDSYEERDAVAAEVEEAYAAVERAAAAVASAATEEQVEREVALATAAADSPVRQRLFELSAVMDEFMKWETKTVALVGPVVVAVSA